MMKYKLIVFDADGTLRYCTVPGQPCPNRAGEWELFPDVVEKLAGFSWAGPGSVSGTGYGIASNQGGVGSGYFAEDTAMSLLHDTFIKAFGFTPARGTIQMCPHIPYSGCSCRKPASGMLDNLIDLYSVDPSTVLFVGDRDDDRNAASNAGCQFQWVSEFFNRNPAE
ncbi:MAG: HAD-IIIA family hydrolase [Candidatus Fermentibacteria bacterium]|nr:HAD-IIIA family hydrolase [Candidatus Fermentibacteria bacterium]